MRMAEEEKEWGEGTETGEVGGEVWDSMGNEGGRGGGYGVRYVDVALISCCVVFSVVYY